MRRLYQKIYLTIVASLVLVVLVAGAVWRLGAENTPAAQAFELAGELIAVALPAGERAAARNSRRRSTASPRGCAPISRCSDPARELIASAGRPLPRPLGDAGGWVHARQGPAWSFQLPDDRWFVVRAPPRHRAPFVGLLLVLGSIALAVAVGAYPVVRGLTRRLERLQTGVETLGAGEPRDARQGQGSRRGRAIGGCLQPLRRAHRGTGECASPAAGERFPRVAHAVVAPAARHRAVRENGGYEIQGSDRARYRRAGCAGRRDPAVEPTRVPIRLCRRSRTSISGARRGGMRAR